MTAISRIVAGPPHASTATCRSVTRDDAARPDNGLSPKGISTIWPGLIVVEKIGPTVPDRPAFTPGPDADTDTPTLGVIP
ncbi:hypothetical protein NOF53_27415, partial [Rhodococcus sp. FXJ9.536]